MKRLAILTGLMVLALLAGVAGTALRPDKAEASPTDVISFNPDVCAAVVVADLLDAGEGVADASDEAAALCYYGPGGGLANPDNLNALAEILGGADITEAEDAVLEGAVDDPDTYGVLVDYSAAQLGSEGTTLPGGQQMWVLTMVTNDENLALDADEGVWLSAGAAGFESSQTQCEPAIANGIADEDCNNDGVKGDGVVVDFLAGHSEADLGDAVITATQAGIDVEMDYTVVGAPDNLALYATKSTISEDAGAACDLSQFDGQIHLPDVTGLLATIVDADGTALTGIVVDWDSSDEDVVHLALVQTGPDQGVRMSTTVSMSADGAVAAPNLGCGGDRGGTTITAFVDYDEAIDGQVSITVIGVPYQVTMDVNPAGITCDGVDSSVFTAHFYDSNGNPVADGTPVEFSVQGPALVNPIMTTTAGGSALTTVTGMSGITIMLPVHAISGAVQASIGVECVGTAPLGDVNCDERVSMVDAMLIAQLVAGIIDELPCGVTQ